MPGRDVEEGSTTEGLPVAPSLGPALEAARVPVETRPVDRRVLTLCGLAVVIAVGAGFVAQGLSALIALLTIGGGAGALVGAETEPVGTA